MSAIKVARLWAEVVDGVPRLDPALGQAGRGTPRDEIFVFLNGGSEVMRAAGNSEDWLAPGHPAVVPIGFRTDGTWLWSEELTYYLREHGVLPEPAFLNHMRERAYIAEEADDAAVRAAEALLRGAA